MLVLLPQHVDPLDGKLAKLAGDEDVSTAHNDEDPGKPQQVVGLLCGCAGQGTDKVFRRQFHRAVGLQACNRCYYIASDTCSILVSVPVQSVEVGEECILCSSGGFCTFKILIRVTLVRNACED